MDRLRVDLMQTKLSVKTAEDKVRRLEMELVEVRQNYDLARRELRELRELSELRAKKRTGNGNISGGGGGGEGKKIKQVRQVPQVHKVTPAVQH